MRTRTAAPLASLALVVLALAGCTAASDDSARGGTSASPPRDLARDEVAPTGAVRDVATDLEAPWSVVLTDDDVPLVSLRDSGDVLELADDGSTRTVGTVDGIRHGGEGGLLGLAVEDDDLFVYSTGQDGNRVERYPLTGRAGSHALGEPTTVLEDLPANSFHNGGRIAFGPDDMLYVSVGDAGERSEAQDRDSLAGKILRVSRTGDVPSDNPFAGSPVWSLGHRNVQGLDWADDGTMFASEFGENTWDELNVIEPGKDYGWPEVEGKGGTDQGFVDPVQQWRTDDASPSGLAVVEDTVFIANLQGEVLRSVPVADPTTSREWFGGTYGRLRTVLEGPDDTLWFVTNNTDGRGSSGAGDDRVLSVDLTD
ncbi:sorbosone dehydrogenase family protein [Curtobacterium sp. MCBA15_001]|uniref:PQQ-dependent sugar dehydrogenase n=1 Tax=Curtobacterium sp. MCBA15_001 TaxID=1898731 RepID=UPI0008DCDB08|nr:PQQ-dependent sugar dehydrogenase [Curtobacterium sp. MCBA15_001]OIH92534.1 glucose dehydrogenase [Curtobacterium sp. MCBA15_001]